MQDENEKEYIDLYNPNSTPMAFSRTTNPPTPIVQTLNDVKIEALLGSGNFGDVYLGKLGGTPCAMKHLKDTKGIKEFEKEMLVLSKLSHPNVVQFLGIHISPTNNDLYMVFEFMEGGSLIQYLIEHRGISIAKRLDFIRDGARGMAYLESKSIIHRDIAARNFLVDAAARVKVSDFGMARDNYYSASNAQVPIKWTAPEVLLQAACTTKSDVYSFGVFMWEVCEEGKQPWGTLSNQEVVSIVTDQMRYLDKPKDSTNELYQIMVRCWSFTPNQRPTFKEIAENMNNICELLTPSKQKIGIPQYTEVE